MDELDDIPTFAKRLKTKFPEYQDIDDVELVERTVRKHPTYAAQVKLPPEFSLLQTTSGYKNLDEVYEKAGRDHNVDPNLLIEQGRIETVNFSPDVVYGRRNSPAGAQGAGQFMPGTAPLYGVKDRTDPIQSINGQAKYMRKLLDQFDGNEDLALAGYNAGEYRDSLKNGQVPKIKETQEYVKLIGGGLKKVREKGLTLNNFYKPQVSTGDVPQQPQDPGTIYGMTDADIKGGATTSPTFATPQPVSTDPVPETPETLQAQVASTFDANSPKSMTLLTNGNPANNFILSMSEAKRLTRVNTPNGIVLVNTKKLGIKPSEATEYVKKNGFAKDSGFVIDMGDNTGDGQPAVVAVDPNTGKEVFAAVTPTPESAQVQAQKNAAMFPGTVQVPTNTDEVVANRVGEMPLDPNIIATADPNQGGAYQGQLPQDINAQLGMQTPMVKQPVGKRQKVGQRPSQQSGTVNFDVDPNDPGVQAALAAQAADPNAKLINRPVGGVKMQEIDSRDANAVSKAYADVINIPANIKTRDEAAKYAGDYLRAKYPNGNFSFSGANSFPTGWNPGDQIGIEYDTLTKAGVDIAPDLAQKVVENRTENPKPNLQVGKNWVQEDAEWLNSNAGKALDLVNPLFGFLDDDTKNTIASSAIGGAIGSGSRVGDAVAGIARWNPLFEMAKPLTGDLSAKMREMSKPGAELELKSGDKSVTSTLFKVAGAAPGDLSRLILLTRFGGAITGGSGVVVGMAADQGLQSAGRQESPWEVAKQTGKGAIIGTIFAAAPTIGKIGGSAVAGGKLAKGFSKEAFTASTIAGGTYATEKAFGTPEDQATQAAIINTLFHLTNTGVKLAGKTIQARDSRGKETNAYVDPDGNIKLLKGEVKKPDVEMYVEAEKGADGVYRAKGDTSPDRVVEEPYSVGNRGNVIGTSREPAQLAEKNPYRIPTAKPEAVAKAAEDPRVQKLATILKTGEPLSLDDLKKASRYSPENVADAVDTLVQAKLVEILPDNTVRLIGEAPGKANVNLFEKYTNPQVDAPVTEVGSQTSVKPVQKPVNTKPSVVSDIAQNEPVSETIDTSVYESLPEQKPQVAEVVKPRAEVITEARPDTAKTLSVFTERGTKAAIEPKVVDASDLLTSADEGYPEQYQPRDRSRTASKAQIAKIASDLNPEFLGDSPKAGDGRPLVVPVMIDGKKKYAVISGNGRTEAIREAYNAGNDGSKAYMEYVGSKGKHEGDKPVYVGILDPNETDLSKFAHEANEQAQARMSPTEQAKADADRMDAGTMAAFIPADDGSIHREANRDFIRGFFDNTVTDAERGAYVQEDGSLNQDGLNRVRNAIFAKAFGDTKQGMAAIQRMAESTSDSVKNVTNALLGRAPHFAAYKDAAGQGMRHKDYDIGNDLMAAVAQYANLRSPDAKIKSVDEYIAQGNMFGAETTPFQTRVMQVLDTYKRSPKAIKAILGNYLSAAHAVGDPNQINIFGQNERPSVESLLEGAVKAYESSISVEPAQESLLDQNQGREAEQVGSPQGRQITQKVGSESQPQGIATRTVEESKPEPPKSESGPADPPKPPTRFATTIPDPERPTPAERNIKAIPLSVKRSMVRREMAKPDADAKLIADAYGLTVEQVENTRQLGPVGKYGQMSHILRKAMADDLELLNKFAKVILPEARVNDNNPLFGTQDAASAILDKIAELAGYGRSSEMGKEGLNKFLDTFADKLPFEAVVLVHDAINHYEEWYRKRQAFAEDIAHSPLMDDIVRQSEQMGKPVITSFKDTPALNTMKKDLRPLSLRARILAIGKKYEIETGADGTRHTGLSRPVIESTFNQVLERELRKRTDFRIGEAGTGKTGETVDRTGKAESEEVDILFAHGDFDGMEDIAGNRLQSAFNSAKRELEQYQYYTDELKAGRRGSSTFGDTEQTELSARKRAFKDAELAWNKYQNDLPKAPNGKPSNLPPHLHKMVRTKAFINWFGDWLKDPANASQAVDENGEPKVLIHGTPTGGFTRFDTGQIGKRSDTSGIHFTDQRSVARTYSGTHDNFVPATSFEDAGIQIEDDGYGYFEIIDPNGDVFEGGFNTRRQAESAAKREFKAGNIPTEEAAANYEAFLNLRPPVMDIDLRQGNWSDEIYWSEKKQQFYTKNEYGDTGYDQGPLPRDAEFYAYNINDLVKQSQDMDDTGLIVRNVTDDGGEMGSNYHGGDSNQYIVFDSKNIKSIYNRGKFSPSNDNILFTNAFDQTDLFGNPVSPVTSQGSLFDMGEPVKKVEVDLNQFVDKKTADFLKSLEKSPDKAVSRSAQTIIGSARYARSKDTKVVIEDAADALDAFSRAKHAHTTVANILKQQTFDKQTVGEMLSPRSTKLAEAMEAGHLGRTLNSELNDSNVQFAEAPESDIQFDANAKSVKRENFKAKQMIKAARALSPLAVSHRAKVAVDPKTRLLQAENMEALAVIHEAVRAIDPEKYGRMSFSGASFTPRAAQELLDVFNSAVDHATATGEPRIATALSKIGNAVEAAIDPKHGDLVMSINIPSLPQLSKHTAQEELSHRNNRRSGAKDIFADIAVTPSIQKSLANLGPGYARIGVTNAVDEVIAKSFRDDAEVELNLSAEEIDSNLDDLMTALAENNIDLAQYATGVENVSKRGKQFAETARQRGERDVQTEPQRTAESDLTTRSTSPIRETGTDSGTRTRTDSEDDRFAKLRQTELSTASGGGSLALRTPSEIALAIPKYEDLLDDEEETKTKLRKAIELIYDGKRDVSVPEAAMNIIRTGYLAGFSVIKTNLVGNSANIVIEQGAKPAMALADILNAKLNPKAKGMRYVPGLSIGDIVVGIFGNNGLISEGIFGNPIETAKTAAKNANTASEKTSFRKEFGKEYRTKRGVIPGMLYGVGEIEASRVDMNISEAKNPNFVRNTGVPLIDAVIEATKRLVVTVDRPFKSFARTADLRGLSRIGAKNFEKQTNPDASFFDQKWRKAMKKFQQDPSLLMYDLAERYAETVTFQNPNAVTDVYDKFRKLLLDEKQLAKLIPTAAQHRLAKHLGGAAYVASGSFAPFVKTPTNIGFRTLEYIFPTGVVSAAWKFYKIGQGYERTHWMEETAEARARLVSAIAGKRGQMDQAFRAETRKYTDGFKRRKEQKVAEFDAKIQSVENSRVLTDVAKKQRIADIKADKAKWLETWKEKKDKYIETREEEFETIDNRRRVADMKTKDEWNAEDMFAEAKFHAFENRQFAEAAGRMTFGTVVGGLLLLGVIKGMIDAVGVTDYDDEKGKWYAKRAAGIPDTSVKIGPYRFPFNQTPFGLAMNMGINQIEQFERPGSNYNRTGAMVKRLGKDTMALNPLTTGEFTKDDFNSWAGSKANSLTPILNMKVLSEVAEIIDEKPRKYWDEGFAAQYLIHVPGLRENLPVSKNALGGDAERGNIVRRLLRAVDPLKTVREQKSQRTLPKTPLDPKPPKN